MGEFFNEDLQRSAGRYLDSRTRLNNFSLVIGIGSIVLIVVFGSKLIVTFKTVFGL